MGLCVLLANNNRNHGETKWDAWLVLPSGLHEWLGASKGRLLTASGNERAPSPIGLAGK